VKALTALTPSPGLTGGDFRYRVHDHVRPIKGDKGFRVGHLDELPVAEQTGQAPAQGRGEAAVNRGRRVATSVRSALAT